ncbi:MAG TPA: hypothetical protein VF980_07015 [Thermoanaerobaculia bacterium]
MAERISLYTAWFGAPPPDPRVAAARLSGDRDALTRAIVERAVRALEPDRHERIALVTTSAEEHHVLLLTVRKRLDVRNYKTAAFVATLVRGGRETQYPVLLVAGVSPAILQRVGSDKIRVDTDIARIDGLAPESLLDVMKRLTGIEADHVYADFPDESWEELPAEDHEARVRLLETLRAVEERKRAVASATYNILDDVWRPGTRLTSRLGLRKLFAFDPPKLPCALLPPHPALAEAVRGAARVETLRCRVEPRGEEPVEGEVVLVCGIGREEILRIASELGYRFVVVADEKTERVTVKRGKVTELRRFDWEELPALASNLFPGRGGNFGAVVTFLFGPEAVATREDLEPWVAEYARTGSRQRVFEALRRRNPEELRRACGAHSWHECARYAGGFFGFAAGPRELPDDEVNAIDPEGWLGLSFALSAQVAAHLRTASARTIVELVRAAGGTEAWIVRGPFIDHLDLTTAATLRSEPFSLDRVHDLIDESLRRLGVEQWTLRWWPSNWMVGMAVEGKGMFAKFAWET